MRQVLGSMTSVVKGMATAAKTMTLECISAVMEKFERQFEELGVATRYYENVTSSATAIRTHQEDVERLMGQVADEAGLEMKRELPDASRIKPGPAEAEENDFEERLRELWEVGVPSRT